MDTSESEKENTMPERTGKKVSSGLGKKSQDSKQVAIQKLQLQEHENVSSSYVCIVYRYTDTKTWNPIVDGYSYIHLILSYTDAKIAHSLRLAESDTKFTYNLMTTTKAFCKENFVRWQDEESGTFGARFSSKDLATEFCNTLKMTVMDLSPYATVDKYPMRVSSMDSARSAGSNGSRDSDGSKELSIHSGTDSISDTPKVQCCTINVQLPSGGATSCLVSVNVKLRDILKKICAAENLKLTFHQFQYVTGQDVGIKSSLLVEDLHSLELKIVDKREIRKSNGSKAAQASNGKSEEKVTQLLRSSSTLNEGIYTEIDSSQKKMNGAHLDVNDGLWQSFLNACNIHQGELSNPTKVAMIEDFVADHGGTRFLMQIRDSKPTRRVIEEMHHLASRIADGQNSPVRELPPPPSTKPPDVPMPFDQRGPEAGYNMRRAASEDVLVSPPTAAVEQSNTLQRKKRKAPRPPSSAQTQMQSAKSLSDLSAGTPSPSMDSPMRRQVSDGSAPVMNSKRKAPPPPSAVRDNVTSPTSSILSTTTTLSSVSPSSSPNFSPRSLDSDFKSDGGHHPMDSLVNGTTKTDDSDKPPPIFCPPPPPDSPPPEEAQSPIGSPDSIGMRSPASSFSQGTTSSRNDSISSTDKIQKPKPRILNAVATVGDNKSNDRNKISKTASVPAPPAEPAPVDPPPQKVESSPTEASPTQENEKSKKEGKNVLSFIAMALSQAEDEDSRPDEIDDKPERKQQQEIKQQPLVRPAPLFKEKSTVSIEPTTSDNKDMTEPMKITKSDIKDSIEVRSDTVEEKSKVVTEEKSKVVTKEKTKVVAEEKSKVVTEEKSKVVTEEKTKVVTEDNEPHNTVSTSEIKNVEMQPISPIITSPQTNSKEKAEDVQSQPIQHNKETTQNNSRQNSTNDDKPVSGISAMAQDILAMDNKSTKSAIPSVEPTPHTVAAPSKKPLSALEMSNAADRERIAMLYKKMKSKNGNKERPLSVASNNSPTTAPAVKQIDSKQNNVLSTAPVAVMSAPPSQPEKATVSEKTSGSVEKLEKTSPVTIEPQPTQPNTTGNEQPSTPPKIVPPPNVAPIVTTVAPAPEVAPIPVVAPLAPVAATTIPVVAPPLGLSVNDLQAQVHALMAQMQMIQQSPNLQQQQLLIQQQMMQQQLLQQVMQQQILQQQNQTQKPIQVNETQPLTVETKAPTTIANVTPISTSTNTSLNGPQPIVTNTVKQPEERTPPPLSPVNIAAKPYSQPSAVGNYARFQPPHKTAHTTNERRPKTSSGRYIPATAPAHNSNPDPTPSSPSIPPKGTVFNRAMSVGARPYSGPPPVANKPKSGAARMKRPMSVDASNLPHTTPMVSSNTDRINAVSEEQSFDNQQDDNQRRMTMSQVKAMFNKPDPTMNQRPHSMIDTSRDTHSNTLPRVGNGPPPIRSKPKMTQRNSFDLSTYGRDENDNKTTKNSPPVVKHFDAASLMDQINAETKKELKSS